MNTPARHILFLLLLIPVLSAEAQDIQSFRSAKPFSIKGNISAGMWYYGTSGIPNRRQPFSWYLTGAPVVSLYGITFPFTVSESPACLSWPLLFSSNAKPLNQALISSGTGLRRKLRKQARWYIDAARPKTYTRAMRSSGSALPLPP